MQVKRRGRFQWETIGFGTKHPLRLALGLVLLAVVLLAAAGYLTSRFTDVSLPRVWQVALQLQPQDAVIDARGRLLILGSQGDLIALDSLGQPSLAHSLEPGRVLGLTPWGALVAGEEGPELMLPTGEQQPLSDWAPGAHLFVTAEGFILAQARAVELAVGDQLWMWQAGHTSSVWWPDRVLLQAATHGTGFVGVTWDTSQDEVNIMLTGFNATGVLWEEPVGKTLPVGLAVLPGQILVAAGQDLIALDGGGRVLWTLATASPLGGMVAGSAGSLLVESPGAPDHHRLTHVSLLGQRSWTRTIRGQLGAMVAGGGHHGLVLDGRVWLVDVNRGQLYRTAIEAHWISLDEANQALVTVSRDGSVSRWLLDGLPGP